MCMSIYTAAFYSSVFLIIALAAAFIGSLPVSTLLDCFWDGLDVVRAHSMYAAVRLFIARSFCNKRNRSHTQHTTKTKSHRYRRTPHTNTRTQNDQRRRRPVFLLIALAAPPYRLLARCHCSRLFLGRIGCGTCPYEY